MELQLRRLEEFPEAVIGQVLLDGKHVCWTKEDPARRPRDGMHVGGETCAPEATYRVTIEVSRRLEKALPFLWNAGHDFGFFIHPGHKGMRLGQETRGCLVVARDRVPSTPEIGGTQPAFFQLAALIDKARDYGERVSLVITDAPKKERKP